jgi:hypothetical protein
MELKPGQQVALTDASSRSLGDVSIEQIDGDQLSGRLFPGPDYSAVQPLFREFEKLIKQGIRSKTDEAGAKIDGLGLCVRAKDGSFFDITDAQLFREQDFSCRIKHHFARQRITAPATTLIVVACLGLPANVLTAFVMDLTRDKSPLKRPAGMSDSAYKSYKLGRTSAPAIDCCLAVGSGLLIYPLMLAGAIQMHRLQSRRLALTASVLALLPCGPMCLFGVPFGIWGLAVLSDPAVKAAFGRS